MVRGAPPDLVLRLVEEPEFRYEDFAPRGEQSPTTMRAQVEHLHAFKIDYLLKINIVFVLFVADLLCKLS